MRTAEQKAADEALTAAVDRVARAYEYVGAAVLTEHVTVAAFRSFDGDDALTTITTLPQDAGLPVHHVLGLLDYATTVYRRSAADGDDGE